MTDLTDIEQRKAWYSQGDDAIRVVLSPYERDALCEALRIAVEGLDRVERWYVCKNVPDDDGDFITCRGFTDDSTGWCGWCCALDAIESVRELVGLGEKP